MRIETSRQGTLPVSRLTPSTVNKVETGVLPDRSEEKAVADGDNVDGNSVIHVNGGSSLGKVVQS